MAIREVYFCDPNPLHLAFRASADRQLAGMRAYMHTWIWELSRSDQRSVRDELASMYREIKLKYPGRHFSGRAHRSWSPGVSRVWQSSPGSDLAEDCG